MIPKGFDFNLEEKEEDGKQYYVLKSKQPAQIGNNLKTSMTLWINKKTMLMDKQEMHSVMKINGRLMESTITQNLSNYKFDQNYPDELFTFKAPEGVKVMDVTEQTMKQLQSPEGIKEPK